MRVLFLVTTFLFVDARRKNELLSGVASGVLDAIWDPDAKHNGGDGGCFGNQTTYNGTPLSYQVETVDHGWGPTDCFETETNNYCVTSGHAFCVKNSDRAFRPKDLHVGALLCTGEEVLKVTRGVHMSLITPEADHPISEAVTLHEIDTHGICTGRITTWSQARLVDKMFLELKPHFDDSQSLRDLPEAYCLEFMLSLTVSSGESTAEGTEQWHLLSNSTQEEAKSEWEEFVWSWPHVSFLLSFGTVTLLLVLLPICFCCGMWQCYVNYKLSSQDEFEIEGDKICVTHQ